MNIILKMSNSVIAYHYNIQKRKEGKREKPEKEKEMFITRSRLN